MSMIWFSAVSAGIRNNPVTSGPRIMPATRYIATSGRLIFCDRNPEIVPAARMTANENSTCLAISKLIADSTHLLPKVLSIINKIPRLLAAGLLFYASTSLRPLRRYFQPSRCFSCLMPAAQFDIYSSKPHRLRLDDLKRKLLLV
jgi:hypothetical protein